MIDRRSFMTGSAAVALAAAVSPSRSGLIAGAPTASPVLAIVDRYIASGEAFAADARARGLRVLEFDSDIAALWMRELEPRLRAGPTALTGCTSGATLFCLELLARDYGACCVQRVDSATSVTWTIASAPPRRAALAPSPTRSAAHA
jgi:hypothetical protein